MKTTLDRSSCTAWASRIGALGVATLVLLRTSPLAAADFTVVQHAPWASYVMSAGLFMIGDFNGDGKSDAIHIVNGADWVDIWLSKGNGTFDVTQFSPWPGYGVSVGKMLIGDFNGDGKSDILHAVAGADYARIWTSLGNGKFSITQFSPWSGYSMKTGRMFVGDFNGDKKADLIHVVDGADFANVWLSVSGSPPFSVKRFSPWSGYAVNVGTMLVGDFDGDGKSDIFHAVAGEDYARVWFSKGDGTFDVKFFSPWANYGMGAGFWLVGDFNGDGKTDVMHAVSGSSFVNVWLSKGDGNFTVNPFQPWLNYAIPQGVWMAGDFDRDGYTDIVHAVENTSYARIWLSNGDGTFNFRTFFPSPNYSIPNGQWLVGDFDGNGKADIFHSVKWANNNWTNYANTWLSNLAGPGEVAVDGIEVVQAIQSMAHDIPIIADKQTLVRLYLAAAPKLPLIVKGTLQVQTAGSPPQTVAVSSTGTVTINPGPNPPLWMKRENIAGSLNFILPGDQIRSGERTFFAPSISLASSGALLPCSNCSQTKRTIKFINGAPLRVRIVGLQYRAPNGSMFAPRPADYDFLTSWLRRAYPVPRVISTTTMVTATPPWPFTCTDANAQLQWMRAGEISTGTVDPRTHYIALVSTGGGYIRG